MKTNCISKSDIWSIKYSSSLYSNFHYDDIVVSAGRCTVEVSTVEIWISSNFECEWFIMFLNWDFVIKRANLDIRLSVILF